MTTVDLDFEKWWEGYSKQEHFNEPLDTLRYSDHDDPNFDELIKGVAKVAYDKGYEIGYIDRGLDSFDN